MNENNRIDQVLLQLNSALSPIEKDTLKQQLVIYINDLLLHDFNRLVLLLYRVDVNEQKLKQLLRENPHTDAAILISDLLIQRHEEKVQARKAFKKNEDPNDEERW